MVCAQPMRCPAVPVSDRPPARRVGAGSVPLLAGGGRPVGTAAWTPFTARRRLSRLLCGERRGEVYTIYTMNKTVVTVALEGPALLGRIVFRFTIVLNI